MPWQCCHEELCLRRPLMQQSICSALDLINPQWAAVSVCSMYSVRSITNAFIVMAKVYCTVLGWM